LRTAIDTLRDYIAGRKAGLLDSAHQRLRTSDFAGEDAAITIDGHAVRLSIEVV
jgi:hypothetical protein